MCLASLITGKNQFINSMPVLYETLPGLFLWVTWHPPALPYRLQHSTIGRSCLNRRVRDGNGCVP